VTECRYFSTLHIICPLLQPYVLYPVNTQFTRDKQRVFNHSLRDKTAYYTEVGSDISVEKKTWLFSKAKFSL